MRTFRQKASKFGVARHGEFERRSIAVAGRVLIAGQRGYGAEGDFVMGEGHSNTHSKLDGLKHVRQIVSTEILRVRRELARKVPTARISLDDLRKFESALVAIRAFIRAAIGTKCNPSTIQLSERQADACDALITASATIHEFEISRASLLVAHEFPEIASLSPSTETPRQRRLRERSEQEARVAHAEFMLSTLSLEELFEELGRHCLGFAGAVLSIGIGNCETWTVRFGGSELMRRKALGLANFNLNAVQEISKKHAVIPNRINRITDALPIPEPLGAIMGEIERRGLASYLTAIDRDAHQRVAGNAVGLFGCELLERMSELWENSCGAA